MALKKSELYSSIWQSCDELRGGMDASQYKDYVFVLLFIKYVSDKYAGQPYAAIVVPKGASFKDMVALKGRSDIRARRDAIMAQWYRDQLKAAIPSILSRWQPLMGVEVERFFVQRMKTMWGSCNHNARTIRLNAELARKPAACLEYIVVHELAHLIEPTHNARFIALMDGLMPKWRSHRDVLNRLPIRQDTWSY